MIAVHDAAGLRSAAAAGHAEGVRNGFGAVVVGHGVADGLGVAQVDIAFEPRELNGQPGALFHDRDGKILHVLALDVLGGRIRTIRSVINPDKLGHLGSVADAWAADRKVKQTRKQTR